MMVFGFLFLLLVGGLFAALMVGGGGTLLNQIGGGGGSQNRQRETARDILDRRLARGEISREEYREIRDQVGP